MSDTQDAVRQARELLEADKRARGEECTRRIDALLAEFRCGYFAFIIANGQRIPITVRIVAYD